MNKKFKIQFPFKTRQGLAVATAIAKYVTGLNPTLLSIVDNVFRFEGGTVVHVELTDIGTAIINNHRVQEFVVTAASARYYNSSDSGSEKSVWDFGPDDLNKIKKGNFGWHHPHVARKEDLKKGSFGVFLDVGRWICFIEENPISNNQGFAHMTQEFSFNHVEGDRSRAYKEAQAHRRNLLANP